MSTRDGMALVFYTNPEAPAQRAVRSADAVIHVYDDAGNVIETHEHAGEFNEL